MGRERIGDVDCLLHVIDARVCNYAGREADLITHCILSCECWLSISIWESDAPARQRKFISHICEHRTGSDVVPKVVLPLPLQSYRMCVG